MQLLRRLRDGILVIALFNASLASATRGAAVRTARAPPPPSSHKAESVSVFEQNLKFFKQENAHRHEVKFTNGESYSLHYHTVGDANITMGDVVLSPSVVDAAIRAEREAAASHNGLLEFDGQRLDASHPAAVELMGVHQTAAGNWPCPVPYSISDDYEYPERVLEAIAHIEARTHWRFVELTDESNWLDFQPSDTCATVVGNQEDVFVSTRNNPDYVPPQVIYLAEGCYTGAAIHEILHSLGMLHEHTASGRDDFLEIMEENIIDTDQILINFEIITDQELISDYNFDSIMHYQSDAFADPVGEITIRVLDEYLNSTCLIGQRQELSYGDVLAAQILYQDALSYGDECPDPTEADPEYPQCEQTTELRLCGRQGINNDINGKYFEQDDEHNGRPAYVKDENFAMFWDPVDELDSTNAEGAWYIGDSVGGNSYFAISPQGNLDPRVTTEWYVYDPRDGSLEVDDAVFGTFCDFGDSGAIWEPGQTRAPVATYTTADAAALSIPRTTLVALASLVAAALLS